MQYIEVPKYIAPSEALLVSCQKPLLVPNADNRAIIDNRRAYRKAYLDCRGRLNKLIEWHKAAGDLK